MKKGVKTALIIVGVIFLIAAVAGVTSYFYIFRDNIEPAVLSFSEGDVQVYQEGWKDAEDGMIVSHKDRVKTMDSPATLTFYDTIIVDLEPGTEVSVEELAEDNVKIRQDSGSTWNKFTAITGVANYEVETPNTVATVRGTEFGVDADSDMITVLEGEVEASSGGKKMMVGEFMRARFADGELKLEELSYEDKKEMLVKTKKMLNELKAVRERAIETKKPMIEKAMNEYDVSEGELRGYLDKIDRGELDDAELIEKSPVKIPLMDRVKRMNDEVKNQMKLIKRLENSMGQDAGEAS